MVGLVRNPSPAVLAFHLFYDLLFGKFDNSCSRRQCASLPKDEVLSAKHLYRDTTGMGNSRAFQEMAGSQIYKLTKPAWDFGLLLLPRVKDLHSTWSRTMTMSQVWVVIIIMSYTWHFMHPQKTCKADGSFKKQHALDTINNLGAGTWPMLFLNYLGQEGSVHGKYPINTFLNRTNHLAMAYKERFH